MDADIRERAAHGERAVDAGAIDRGGNDDRTDAVDAITNVLHWLDRTGELDTASPDLAANGVVAEAVAHFTHEREHGATL